ncbi:RNA polymerase-associated protein rtf1 [Dispira simplex]|nr:RNA polymerase-associated protein rtf1 [Dispira simplex]
MSDDLNDEILALYGGDTTKDTRGRKRRSTHSPSDDDDNDSDVDSLDNVTYSTRQSRDSRPRRRTASPLPHDGWSSEAELTGYPDTPGSPVDQEMKELMRELDEYEEDLMGDDQDRRELMALPEIERERILTERAERRQHVLERLEVKRKLRDQNRQPYPMSREESSRSSRRSAKATGKTAKLRELSELKRRRERHEGSGRKQGTLSPMGYSDESAGEYYPEEETYGGRVSQQHGRMVTAEEDQEPPASLEEINRIRMTRDRLERWVNYPFFEKTVVGCMVRFGIGVNNGNPVYRAAEVIGVMTEKEPYQVGQAWTNKLLVLKHGRAERGFRMATVSNQPITQREYERLMHITKADEMDPVPTSRIPQKVADIDAARNYVLSDKEVEEMIKLRRQLTQAPVNYVTERSQLEREKHVAQQQGDLESVRRLEQELTRLNQVMEADTHSNLSLNVLAEINRRNRKLNQEEGRRAEERLLGNKRSTPYASRKGTTNLLENIVLAGADDPRLPLPPCFPSSVALISNLNSLQNEKTLRAQADYLKRMTEALPEAQLAIGRTAPLSAYERHLANASFNINIDLDDLTRLPPAPVSVEMTSGE